MVFGPTVERTNVDEHAAPLRLRSSLDFWCYLTHKYVGLNVVAEYRSAEACNPWFTLAGQGCTSTHPTCVLWDTSPQLAKIKSLIA